MDQLLTQIIGLLIIAVLVALAARWLKLPYTVGLVFVGIIMAATQSPTDLQLTPDFIFEFILPPLLFEAALNIHWRELQRDFSIVLSLAIFGTVIAASVITAGLVALGWPLKSAAMFGILIAATDPVAVIAMFKDNGVGGRLRLLTEAESLFNDGVAAVLFILALGWATDGDISAAHDVEVFLITVGGGIFLGALCAGAALAIAGQTGDHLVESTITAVTAFGSFQLAQYFQCSGVLATITAGLLIGNFGVLAGDEQSQMTAQGREFALALWEFIAFIANSLVFLLIGVTVAKIPFSQLGFAALGGIILLVLLGRAAGVYPLCFLFTKSRHAVSLGEQHVLWWGGLKGALGLALAMALPLTLPFRNEILIATFGVVSFSIIAQGLTMPLLLKRLGFIEARPN
jgi:CPA1 family monovalent cation:H+ antiporter